MIIHPNTNWIAILTTLRGSIARRIAPRCILITALASLIVWVESLYPATFQGSSAMPFTLLGLSLSIFMSFRNNACYARWWEGRQMWGKIIIEIRSFSREVSTLTDNHLRIELVHALCGFAHSLNARLRDRDEFEASRPWLPDTFRGDDCHNVSDAILMHVGRCCSDLADRAQISEWRYITLEQRLVGLSEAQANCERIKNTPLPFPYTLLLHRTTLIFCLLLPFALAQPLGWLAPLFTSIVSYTFFGLDTIGDELEDPFGFDENDLPIDAMVRSIERDIFGASAQASLPPVLEPVNGVLT
ncbi:bestrophin family protein [Marinobacter qingdaonensis]|uniref:Bestrophin family protein n=1 Tax=Marinobacter qingdaonensis TaxID=3108486 RepID=A0ABU5P1Z7_9GAMM|nr:bestrophin family protein [Marinobacter sp. ASW11-75]MCS5582888.1 bestrophin family protein [Pseudomonadales bacterium]MEA1082060.1 bestrophin family protein [Marinobacter sp. ASW11-75]